MTAEDAVEGEPVDAGDDLAAVKAGMLAAACGQHPFGERREPGPCGAELGGERRAARRLEKQLVARDEEIARALQVDDGGGEQFRRLSGAQRCRDLEIRGRLEVEREVMGKRRLEQRVARPKVVRGRSLGQAGFAVDRTVGEAAGTLPRQHPQRGVEREAAPGAPRNWGSGGGGWSFHYRCSINANVDGADDFDGALLARGESGYERARRAAVWNGRLPDRMPDLIAVSASEQDVARAVRVAAREGMRIGIRSGGHSWSGSHLRDGGMLIDVSRLRGVEVNLEAGTARVQPGLPGNELIAALERHDLFFPAGHCPGVALGGYLLQGGFGWNGRVHGPACMSVEAIEVVTAAGEVVRADATENPDLFWAARGAGPGFFAAVTAFHVRLYARPRVVANALFSFPIDCLEEVFGWAHEVAGRVDRATEMMLFIHRGESGAPEIALTGPTLVDDEERARAALAVLATCPARTRATVDLPYATATMPDLYAGAQASYPDGSRYAVDNMWTHASAAELAPLLRRAAETIPESPSHLLWMNWGPGAEPAPERPEMAFSVEDDTYIALYGVWADRAEDDVNTAWPTGLMRAAEPLASGIQLADENLAERPARFIEAGRMQRLDAVRAEWDPERRFHPWMGRL